jgi:hypothetical protein
MRAPTLALLAVLALPAIAGAQAEDRQRTPTAEAAAAADPCANSMERSRGPRATWPGFDPRLPMPAGATSFTGIAPPARDPSRDNLQAPGPTDMAYQDCRGRTGN